MTDPVIPSNEILAVLNLRDLLTAGLVPKGFNKSKYNDMFRFLSYHQHMNLIYLF